MWALGKYVFTTRLDPLDLTNVVLPALDIYGKCKPAMTSFQEWKPSSSEQDFYLPKDVKI